MNRTPDPGSGPAHRIRTADLGPGDVPHLDPGDDTSVGEVVEFAHTFNGYAHAGGPPRLGPLVSEAMDRVARGEDLPTHPDDLRALLFGWTRADRMGGGVGPVRPEDVRFVQAVLQALREAVADRRP